MRIKLIIITLASCSVVLIPTQDSKISHPSTIGQAVSVSKPLPALPKVDYKPQALLASKVVVKAPEAPKQAPAVPQGNVEAIVRAAATKYGVSPDHMVRIATCESTLNPNSVAPNIIDGGHPTGLFQHVSTYWAGRAAKYGWAGASIFNAQAQAEVTAQMFRDGAAGLWECH